MQIVEQTAALTDQTQKSAARMMVFRVRLQMLGKLLNPRREQRYLYFGRAAIVLSPGVGFYDFPLAGGLEGHQLFFLSLYPLFAAEPNRGIEASKATPLRARVKVTLTCVS